MPVACAPFLLDEAEEKDHPLFETDVECETLVHLEVVPSYLKEALNVKVAIFEPEDSFIVYMRLDEILLEDTNVLM